MFAPDDSAFAKLPNGTVTFLLWPENNQVLFELLAYHSVASQLMSDQLITFSYTTLASLLDADNVDTLNVVIDSPGDGDKDDAIITLTNGNTTAKVVQADLLSSQGVAHQIDSVLVPSFVTLPDKDLVDTAIANNFTMLVAALQAAGLADTLRGTGPYTVYAPIDSAFDLLDIPALLENTEILSELLQYHVQAGTNYKAGMVDGLPFTMLQGDNVTITVLEDGSAMNKFRLMDQDKYMVNDATITDTDIVTLNGIIHVINKVLIPPDLDLSCCLATREFLLEEDTKIDIQCFPTPSLSSQCDWGDDGGFPGWTDGLGAIGIDGFTFFNSNGNLTLMADSSISTNALVECSANCVCFVQQTGLPCLKSGETRAPTDAPTNAPILPTESPVLFPTDVILDEGVAICNICGDGKEITNPDGIIQISNQPDQTCMALDIAGQAGLISDPQCLAYSLITQDTCGCTLTPVPTLIPVLPPTDQPLSAAPSSIGSSAPTTSAPTQGSVTSDPSFTRSPTNLPTGNPTFKPPTDLPGPTSPPTLGAPTPLLGLLETLEAEGEFTSLLQAAEATNLGALLPKTPITLFAPTDDAFAALPTGYWDYLLWPENVPILLGGLAYHAVNGDFPAASLGDRQVLDTFGSLFDPIDNSATLKIGLSDIGVRVEGSVNDVNVIKADIFYTTGTIHKIDGVLVADYLQAAIPPNDLVDTAIANNFTILVAAIQAAGLENTLRVPNGPFTVFAPTDQAFAALPKDILAALLLPENQPILYDILLYHVAANNTYAKDLDNGVNITTLLGEDRPQLPVTKDGDIVMVANATVIKHDVVTLNGIIHVIDTVLLPTDLELPTLPNPYCPICGDGKYVNNSDGIVDIPEVGNQSCAELEQSSLAGLIPAESCPLLQQLTQAPCDCQEVDILTPTPVPTMTPTTSSTEEEIAYCGDCHCIPGANETCPANKPQTDFSDLFDTYEGLTLENPHILTCNPFQDDDECETVPPLENGEACVVELVALREDGTSTTCPDRSYR